MRIAIEEQIANYQNYVYDQPSIVQFVKQQRVKRLGYVQKMDSGRETKILMNIDLLAKRVRERPGNRWKEEVIQDIRKLGVKDWKTKAADRREWRKTRHNGSKGD